MARSRWLTWVLLAALVGLTGVALVATRRDGRLVTVVRRPERVMGTSCTLLAVVPASRTSDGRRALERAEAALRGVEARMSVHLERSEVGRLNRAAAGETVRLSPDTLAVLAAALRIHRDSEGAFDVTCRPLLELWRERARIGRLPSSEELIAARGKSSWQQLALLSDGVRKLGSGVRVDLGGIAKGWGVDAAVGVLEAAGCVGGLVEVGGDLRLWGTRPEGGAWPVEVRDPFADAVMVTLRLSAGAVCTSGNYARGVEVGGRRYSHVVDPRTGWPADAVPSVTVAAADALTADAWATALSVLGPDGLNLLPADGRVEALLVTGTPQRCEVHASPGMSSLLEGDVHPACSAER